MRQDANTAKPSTDIIVVTYDNKEYLDRCITSLVRNTSEPFRLIIVNNGNIDLSVPSVKNTVIIKMPKNEGWMKGVNAGVKWSLDNSDSPFIMWMNDDTQVLDHDYGWLTKMINAFQLDPKIGAVGPTSNAVMGYQSIHYQCLPPHVEASRLSGMCFLTKREVIKDVGLLDESLPGGDDLDISIRYRTKGYKLCICRRAFLLHHYAITGRRVHGQYWDSRDHTEALNKALIQKHGFKAWMECVTDHIGAAGYDFISPEEQAALAELGPFLDGKVLDLGCGGKKIDTRAIGVDIRSSEQAGVGANLDHPSVGEVTCDVTDLSIFETGSIDGILAKHLLEHIIDPIKALKEWKRVLKDGGRLVIICPDYRYCEAISVDPSHVHAFTPDSVKSFVSVIEGLSVVNSFDIRPGFVFGLSIEKVPIKASPVMVYENYSTSNA